MTLAVSHRFTSEPTPAERLALRAAMAVTTSVTRRMDRRTAAAAANAAAGAGAAAARDTREAHRLQAYRLGLR